MTKAQKREVGRPSTPRWEIDLVAYKAAKNELLAVECKSFLDSTGVIFRDGAFVRLNAPSCSANQPFEMSCSPRWQPSAT